MGFLAVDLSPVLPLPSHFGGCVGWVFGCVGECGRCGNVAAILELDEHLEMSFKTFTAAPQEARGLPARSSPPDYFLVRT